jgi:inositol phosphorylceramide mannosyltransferase catalytic subunit
MAEKIPRRIIQIWGGEAGLPLLFKAAAANARLLNPDFEYLLFDDAGMTDFIARHFAAYTRVFESYRHPIQRYDFFRYLAVYQLGGFYFDMDVLLASSLEDLLGFSCVFPFEHLTIHRFLCEEYGMDWEIGNWTPLKTWRAARGRDSLAA